MEELHLLARLMRGFGSDNVDFRLRQSDFAGDGSDEGVPWLGMPIAEVGALDRVLLIGSFLRKDQPLLSTRLRHATKRRAQLSVLHAAADDLLMNTAHKLIVRPGAWVRALAEIAAAIAERRGEPAPATGVTAGAVARAIAASLLSGERKAVLLGNAALQHPQAAQLRAWAQWIARACGATIGVLGDGANAAGGHLVGARPRDGGLNARTMLEQPRRAYLLWNFEPDYDTADPVLTCRGARGGRNSDRVLAVPQRCAGIRRRHPADRTVQRNRRRLRQCRRPGAELQRHRASARRVPSRMEGAARARQLLLQLDGFDYETVEAVRAER